MGSEKMRLISGDIAETNRKGWILDTCAKAIAKEIEQGSGESIIGLLLDQVAVEVNILRDKIVRG